jgi:hypothetical protein
VREGPGYEYGRLGVNPRGSQGVVVDVASSGRGSYCYWKVDYDTGFDGWSADYYLEKVEGGASFTDGQRQAVIDSLNSQIQRLQEMLDRILALIQQFSQ